MQTYEQELTVTKDHLDHLNHVNNIEYVRWVQDIAAAHWEFKTSETTHKSYYWVLLSHHIQYKAEAFLDDQLVLKTYAVKSGALRSIRTVDIYNKKTNKLLATSETKWCFMSYNTNKPTRIPDDVMQLF
ncbi:acyl-CoA thioesterase [Psychroserpens damuponensis]|uniref:acyl-CoA thioesterase n=1 Tax=Psychroserpens damuponensis TaxID=943936 RepID=UPI000591354E|nr:thioesterase family protein [Psychroserpens damuponensis]